MNTTLSNDTAATKTLVNGSQMTRMFVRPDAQVGINDQLATGIDADGCKELIDGIRKGPKMILVVQAGLEKDQILALIEKVKDVYDGTTDLHIAGTAADRRIGIHVKSTEVISFDVRQPNKFKKYDLHGAVYRDSDTGEIEFGFQSGNEVGFYPIEKAIGMLDDDTMLEVLRDNAKYIEDGEFICRGFTGKYGEQRYFWTTDGKDNTSVFATDGNIIATYPEYVKPMVDDNGMIDGKLFASFVDTDKYDLTVIDRDEAVGKTAELIESWTGNFYSDSIETDEMHAPPSGQYRAK
jgi:hypothetical protein